MTLVVAVGLVGGAVAAAQTAPKPDPLADADRTVEQLRRQADAASAAYFTELARFETLDREVNDLETKIPLLQQRAQKLRAQVQERAVAAYERSSSQMAAIIDSTDSLDFARRTKLLEPAQRATTTRCSRR